MSGLRASIDAAGRVGPTMSVTAGLFRGVVVAAVVLAVGACSPGSPDPQARPDDDEPATAEARIGADGGVLGRIPDVVREVEPSVVVVLTDKGEELLGAIRRHDPGDTIRIRIVRDDGESEVQVTFTERPTASAT